MANHKDEKLIQRFIEEVTEVSDQDDLTGFTAHLTLARVYLSMGELEKMNNHLEELHKKKPKTFPNDLQMRLERLDEAYKHRIEEH